MFNHSHLLTSTRSEPGALSTNRVGDPPRSPWFPVLMTLLISATSSAQTTPPTYWKDVRPILRKSCTVCHNPRQLIEKEVSGGIALDTYEKTLKHLKRGKSTDSPLYTFLINPDTEKRMPLGANPLDTASIAMVKAWIDAGAPEGIRPEETPVPPRTAVRTRKMDVTFPATMANLTLNIGPLSPVVAVAFHPEKRLLAAGSYGRVTLWNLKTGEPERVITSVLGAVNDLRFSPDGKTLAVAGGQPSAKGDLRLVDAATGELRHVLPGHDDVVAAVAWRFDGKQLASASYDRTVRTWDASGKRLNTFTHHSDFALTVGYSPDGKTLYTGSKDRSVRVLDANTGASKFTYSDRDDDVLTLAVHPDGKAVVASGLTPTLSWWDVTNSSKLRGIGGHRGAVYEVAFDRKGTTLISAGEDGTLKLWNGSTGVLVRSIPVGSLVYSAAISADGQLAAAGSFDGVVRVYETAGGKHLATLIAPPTGWLTQTPDGQVVGSAELLKDAKFSLAGKPLDVTKVVSGEAVRRSLSAIK